MERFETHFEYLSDEEKRDLVRDVIGKKTGNVDLDWSEIAEKYDLSISPDTLRKAAVGLKLADDAGMLTEPKAETLFETSSLERQKMRDLVSQMKEAERQEARQELLHETVRNAIASLDPIEVPNRNAILHYSNESGDDSNDRPVREMIVGLGDFHYGADWEIHGLYGETLNRFTPEIFEDRMWELRDQILEILRTNRVECLHLFFVGDLIDGMLRQSQLMKLRYGVVESTIRLSEFLARWIAGFTGRVGGINIHMVTGNHSETRPLGSKKDDFENENMEKIVFWYLKERLKDCAWIVFEGDCGKLHVADVCGFKFLLLHGDGSKDISALARDAVNLYGTRIDYFVCGHLHKETEYPSGMTPDGNSYIIRVPSMCGADRYAQKLYCGGKPGATAILMEEGYGRKCVYPISIKS